MMSPAEIAGFKLSLAIVVFDTKALNWPLYLAVVSAILCFFVFKDSFLHGEAGLHLVLAAPALWVLRAWLKSLQHKDA